MSEPVKPQDLLDIEKAHADIENYIKLILDGQWPGKNCLVVANLLGFLNGAAAQIRGQHEAHPYVIANKAAKAPVNG